MSAHEQEVPRVVLLGAGAMILLAVGLAAAARHHQSAAPAAAPPIAVLDLRFEDRPDGAIAVVDADSGRQVSLVAPRSNGFIRGVMRGMFRARKLESLGHEAPFHLAREADGRLSLLDPQTGRRVDLDSFGPDNSAAFAGILAAGLRRE